MEQEDCHVLLLSDFIEPILHLHANLLHAIIETWGYGHACNFPPKCREAEKTGVTENGFLVK